MLNNNTAKMLTVYEIVLALLLLIIIDFFVFIGRWPELKKDVVFVVFFMVLRPDFPCGVPFKISKAS